MVWGLLNYDLPTCSKGFFLCILFHFLTWLLYIILLYCCAKGFLVLPVIIDDRRSLISKFPILLIRTFCLGSLMALSDLTDLSLLFDPRLGFALSNEGSTWRSAGMSSSPFVCLFVVAVGLCGRGGGGG